MRISDWSSDVCSSDLADLRRQHGPARENGCRQAGQHVHAQPQGCSYRRTRSRIEAGPYRKKCAGLNARQSPCNQSPCWHVMPEGWTLRARVRPKNTARRIMTMTFRLLLTARSEEHTSELQSLMRISYAVFCLQKKTTNL